MSSMMNKVKDALKSDHGSSEHDAYDSTSAGHHGRHGQTGSSMPGAFGTDVNEADAAGDSKYGRAVTTGQSHVQSPGQGHDSAYERATQGMGTHGTSKYAQEPTQSSYRQDHGALGGSNTGTLGGTHVSRKEVPDSQLMDPASHERDSNIMDRSRQDYGTEDTTGGGLASSGSHKLHKSNDPRRNYDNSPSSARADQEHALRQEHGGTTTHTTTHTSAYGTDPLKNTREAGYGDTSRSNRDTGLGNNTSSVTGGNTDSSGEPRHQSKLLNKLDPRVDNDAIPDKESSRHQEKDSRLGGGAGTGASAAAATAAATHGAHRDQKTDRTDYGTDPTSSRATYGTAGRDTRDTYGTTGSGLPTRTRDEYNTAGTTSSYDPRYTSGATGAAAPLVSDATHGQGHHQGTYRSSSPKIPYGRSGATDPEHHDYHRDRQASSAIPYGRSGSQPRSHFHCMNCGHRNDASHLTDAKGGAVTGRDELHCMDCGHRNRVGHLFGRS